MIRYGVFTIDSVLSKIGPHSHLFEIEDRKFLVKMNSQRYKLFRKSIACISCRREGHYFALESDKEHIKWVSKLISNAKLKPHYRLHPFYLAHFNLYSLANGKDTLMTKDHIIPVSRGGNNYMSNYQVMCANCNSWKGNSVTKFPKAEKFLYDFEKGLK